MHAPKPAHTFAKERRAWNDPVANPPKGHQAFIPLPPKRGSNLTLELETILPGITDEISHKKLVFHMVGDTGGIHGTETQDALATAMEAQFVPGPERPRFLFHLGDVIYFNGQADGYQAQFYEPYQHLDYPIFAIPGNHDCGGDPKLWNHDGPNAGTQHPLKGFMDNFCSGRAVHLNKHRTAMTQPYCHWSLDTPLFKIIGLNSNVDGLLDPPGTTEQFDWFHSELLSSHCSLVAVHHPPFSLDTNHGGYGAIYEALKSARVHPMLPNPMRGVFTGHVHNYQRFNWDGTPCVIAGAGGYANSARAMHKLPKALVTNLSAPERTPEPAEGRLLKTETTMKGVSLEYANETDPGFLRITATSGHRRPEFLAEYFIVPFGTDQAKLFDTFRF